MPIPDEIIQDRILVPGPSGTAQSGTAITDLQNRVAALEAVVAPPQAAIVSGLYYGPLTTLDGWEGPLTDQLIAANYLYAAPFLCPQDAAFNQVGVEVITPATGGTVRIGLYGVGADGMPGALVQELGVIDASATGWRSVPITATVPRGLYWIAGGRNANIGLARIPATAGMTAMLGYLGTTATLPRAGLYQTATLSPGFTSLPATFGAMTTTGSVTAYQMRAG